jgi:hypothetical protein
MFPNATCLDLITDSMINISELAQGETPNAEDAVFMQTRLNAMLDSFSLERLWLPDVVRVAETLTANTYQYTLGQSGFPSFNTQRPTLIQSVAIIDGNGVTHNLNILNAKEWYALKQKGVATAPLPEDVYIDGAWPNLNIYFNPVPTLASNIEFVTWMALQSFPSLVTVFPAIPGYYEAVMWSLCTRIADGYNKQVTPSMAANAAAGMSTLKNFNTQLLLGSLGPSRTLSAPNIGQPVGVPAAPQGAPPAQG